jgi:putative membrane protein
MKKTLTFINSSVIVAALTIAPAAAQSTSGQGGAGQTGSTQSGSGQSSQPKSGTQSGQTTGSGSGGDTRQQDKNRDKVTSYGEKVGEDVPSAGTQTDQRGRTAAKGADASTPGTLAGPDRTFLTDAMEGNRAEVELAQLAQRKADSQAVRDLAKTIQQDHEQANQKLKSIAGKVDAADNAPNLKPEHKQLSDRLSKLDGAAFDQAYASEMVKDHQKDIAKYEKASRQLQQPELKSYATETLPNLKHHLEMARSAQSQVSSTKTK